MIGLALLFLAGFVVPALAFVAVVAWLVKSNRQIVEGDGQ